MKDFVAQCIITEKVDRIIQINDYSFNLFKANFSDNIKDFKILIPTRNGVNVGDYIVIDKAYLTYIDDPEDTGNLAVRAKSYTVVEKESFTLPEFFRVSIVGKFIRTDKSKMVYLGVERTPILRTTLRFKTETNVLVNVCLLGLNKRAHLLDTTESGILISTVCYLVPSKRKGGYELKLITLEPVKEIV